MLNPLRAPGNPSSICRLRGVSILSDSKLIAACPSHSPFFSFLVNLGGTLWHIFPLTLPLRLMPRSPEVYSPSSPKITCTLLIYALSTVFWCGFLSFFMCLPATLFICCSLGLCYFIPPHVSSCVCCVYSASSFMVWNGVTPCSFAFFVVWFASPTRQGGPGLEAPFGSFADHPLMNEPYIAASSSHYLSWQLLFVFKHGSRKPTPSYTLEGGGGVYLSFLSFFLKSIVCA